MRNVNFLQERFIFIEILCILLSSLLPRKKNSIPREDFPVGADCETRRGRVRRETADFLGVISFKKDNNCLNSDWSDCNRRRLSVGCRKATDEGDM